MFDAILFDLDDTLLINPVAESIPAYFELLSHYLEGRVDSPLLVAELLRGIKAMDANDGTGPTNEEAFDAVFYAGLGSTKEALGPVFERFYAEEYGKLRSYTRPLPEAVEIVEWTLTKGIPAVVATNPLYPLTAIQQRLEWAQLPVSEFGFARVTSYENSHATKAHPAYYEEIAAVLGCDPRRCLMVGDDWARDISPAVEAGLSVYWIEVPGDPPHPKDLPDPIPERQYLGQGSLRELLQQLDGGKNG